MMLSEERGMRPWLSSNIGSYLRKEGVAPHLAIIRELQHEVKSDQNTVLA
jgi:hypothetical protein